MARQRRGRRHPHPPPRLGDSPALARRGGVLSAVVLAGASVFVVGVALDSTIGFGLAESVEDIDPSGVQALQALWDNDGLPIVIGQIVFLIASGISIVRHRALPAWLGWAAIVIAVVTVVADIGGRPPQASGSSSSA